MDNTEKARELINKHLYLHGGDGLGITDGDVYRAVLDAVSEALTIPFVSNCYAVFDEEDNIVQLYQTEYKANKGLVEFKKSHPHTEFYVDTMEIN